MAKSPAFQFYPGDWLSSEKVMLMSPAQEGAYIRLLAIAWGAEDCGLPDDDQKLAILSRLGEGWLNGGSSVVRQCFFSEGGRIYNARLLEERKKQKEWKEKSAAGGRKSGKVRRDKKLAGAKGGSEMVGTKREPNTNSSSSSSSSSSKDITTCVDDAFDILWKKYPRRLGRKEAFRHFKASVKTEDDLVAINAALDTFKAQMDIEARAPDKIQHGSTWFNNWRDWISYEPPPAPKTPEDVRRERQRPTHCGMCGKTLAEGELVGDYHKLCSERVEQGKCTRCGKQRVAKEVRMSHSFLCPECNERQSKEG